MLVELNGKGGQVCAEAKSGKIRCPLMVRPTSEDVITSRIFSSLKCINPRWWLPDFLSAALGDGRFRPQIFRKLAINLWVRQKGVPKGLVPWNEGQTEVDIVISWENPPTTVFVEMKYLSPLSSNTTDSRRQSEYPTDQLIRNIRIGLWKCDWYYEQKLFEDQPRDFYTILFSPKNGNPLVRKYKSKKSIQEAIPNSNLLADLPDQPFVGEVSFRQLCNILRGNLENMTWSERSSVTLLVDYLDLKLSQQRSVGDASK